MTTESSSELLGEVISWDIQSTEVGFSAVQTALLSSGLEVDEAREIGPKAGFSRACKYLKEKRAIDKLANHGGIITFQFTRKENDSGRIDYDYECLITLDTDTGDVGCPENPVLAAQAKELLDHAMQTRTSQDITRIIQRMFAKHADLYAINKKGCAYFVPEQHRGFTEKVDAFLHAMGGALARFPVPKGTPQGNASVKEAVQSGLQSLLGELSAAVEGWDETTRKSTMDKAMERWQAIRHKVECYEEYLGAEQERLKEELSRAKEELARRITELKPDESEAESDSGAESEQLTSV